MPREDVQDIRQSIDKLFKRVDIPLNLNKSKTKSSQPPEIIHNLPGSVAGAGSGEFHVYRHLRRKEMTRVAEIEKEARMELEAKSLQEKVNLLKQLDEQRTAKKREKRLKRRQNRSNKKVKTDSSSSEDDAQ